MNDFSDNNLKERTKRIQQIKGLQGIISEKIASCYTLLPAIQLEKPFSDLSGMKNFLGILFFNLFYHLIFSIIHIEFLTNYFKTSDDMYEIFQLENAMFSTFEHFEKEGPVYQLRLKMKSVANSFSEDISSFLLNIFHNQSFRERNLLSCSVELMKNKFNEER